MNTENARPTHAEVRDLDALSRLVDVEITQRQEKMEAVANRIKSSRSHLSQRDMANLMGVHVNTWGKLERGEIYPDAHQLLLIAAITQCNPAWLLLGGDHPEHVPENAGLTVGSGDLVLVPSYEVTASAGNGAEVVEENVVGRFAFKKSWISRKGLNPAQLAVVTARGDSMEPTVRDGDILLIDRDAAKIGSDGIYLIERDNQLFCKRLQKLFDGGVKIMSDNARYAPQQLSPEAAGDLHVTGRVVWIGGER
jgi:phage repressor protein C with HTH and peptisase S24 domain